LSSIEEDFFHVAIVVVITLLFSAVRVGRADVVCFLLLLPAVDTPSSQKSSFGAAAAAKNEWRGEQGGGERE
jgi:hypothetical protein